MRIILLAVAVAPYGAAVSDALSLLQTSSKKQPKPTGHLLTDTELAPITSIACLQLRQRDPTSKCTNTTPSENTAAPKPQHVNTINAGNYPSYDDPACHSYGEFICDPDEFLNASERQALAKKLKEVRQSTQVKCGGLLGEPDDIQHFQPFYLGVVLTTKHWPPSETDADSLQTFGQFVDYSWNMDRLYVGSSVPYTRCPNSAVLIVLPGLRQAYLSSGSCEFICAARGGPEIVTSVVSLLDLGGLARGVTHGVETAYNILAKTTSASGAIAMHYPSSDNGSPADSDPSIDSITQSEGVWLILQRALFFFSVMMLVASLGVAFIVCMLSPAGLKNSRWKHPFST